MISFNNQDIKYKLSDKKQLKQWITTVVHSKNRRVGDIAFIFCSDEYLLEINKQYLNHKTLTDIITFDYSKENPQLPISGDIYISIDRIKYNAQKFAVSDENELYRVIIHGVLHLLGYKDKTKAAKDEMTKQENFCLKLLEKNSIHQNSVKSYPQ
jgi:probable rRNA maturation factor